MKNFQIFFSDLIPETQQQLLKFYNITDPEDMQWDSEPLYILETEELLSPDEICYIISNNVDLFDEARQIVKTRLINECKIMWLSNINCEEHKDNLSYYTLTRDLILFPDLHKELSDLINGGD